MKSYKNKLLAGLLAGAVALSLAGCGKGGGKESQPRKEFYYVPEYQKLELGVDYIGNPGAAGGSLI
ncbi:MAG: hypothetical protein K2P13_10185, partial [Lachnospiraceae bacterium]|nr:hypothetical protein [Lachnospiraceae bacterium]